VKESVKAFFGKEPHQGVNPDEVVAVGAAVQAGILSGDVKDMVLLDVTPLSLGIETMGNVMTVMIPRNTTLPTQKKETFSTAADDQPSVEVHVLQGERTQSQLNRTLGRFSLDGIIAAPRGVPKIEVSFDIDANGILSVRAKDTATGKDQKITITTSSGLNESEIQKMVQDAAENEAADKARRTDVERRNKLDNLCYNAEKTLRDSQGKLEATDAGMLEALVREGQKAIELEDAVLIASVTERLEKEAQRLASGDYAKAPENASGQPASSRGDRTASNVVDAEFEESQQHGHP